MLIDIYVKFREDSLNGFQVIERTRFCDGQSSKETNSKNIKASNMLLALCTSSNFIDIDMKFGDNSLKGFQVIERTRFCDGQSSKRNNSKCIKARVIILVPCTSSNVN